MTYILSAIVLGVSSALSPGPLLMLIVSETVKYGVRAGVRVCFAPLITDGPVILIGWLLLSRLTQADLLLGVISLFGAGYLLYLGWESFSFQGLEVETSSTAVSSMRKGIITNLLSPSPYLFWLTIGIPILVNAWREQALYAVLFIAIFFILLVGLKIVLTILIGKGRKLLNSRGYIFLNRFLGVLLWGYAVWFLEKAIAYIA